MWQGAIGAPGRGQRGTRGEAVLAQREVEGVGPGMGMGKKAGGLEVREAGGQALSDGGGGRFSACEPGERVGGRAERDQ